MPADPFPRGTGSTPGDPPVAGHLLRQIRDQLGLTQEALAERLAVPVNTLKSWETGRRPIGQVKVATLNLLRRTLLRLGAAPRLLDRLDTAVDVDLFIHDVLHEQTTPGEHRLAHWVSTRDWNDMLAAAVTPNGAPQGQLAPVDRRRFYDVIRDTADRVTSTTPSGILLRRQVYFLAARDDSAPGRDWLAAAERRELRDMRRVDGWTPTWVAGRSVAVARACQGDPDQLQHFIAHRIVGDDLCEAANLNYWAHWIGETGVDAVTDEFMAADLGTWRGARLLGHLTAGLRAGTPYLALSIHTLWALLERRPYLLHDDMTVTDELRWRIQTLLDNPPPHMGEQARRELDQLRYATRMTARGPR